MKTEIIGLLILVFITGMIAGMITIMIIEGKHKDIGIALIGLVALISSLIFSIVAQLGKL